MAQENLGDLVEKAREAAKRQVLITLRTSLQHVLNRSASQRDDSPTATDQEVYIAAKAFCEEYEHGIPVFRCTDIEDLAGVAMRRNSKRSMDERINTPK